MFTNLAIDRGHRGTSSTLRPRHRLPGLLGCLAHLEARLPFGHGRPVGGVQHQVLRRAPQMGHPSELGKPWENHGKNMGR